MKAKIAMVVLTALLGCCVLSICQADTNPYGFKHSGGFIRVAYPQPNGDLLIDGSGMAGPDVSYNTDHAIIRLAPDGEVRWAHHFPYISEYGDTWLFELSDGRYASGEHDPDENLYMYIFDADEGLVKECEPVQAEILFPMDGYILGVGGTRTNSVRLLWISLDGVLENQTEYSFEERVVITDIVKSDGGFTMMTTLEDNEAIVLTKIQDDGSIQWQDEYVMPSSNAYTVGSEPRGGIFIMCDPGPDYDQCYVMYVDKEGNKQWDLSPRRGNVQISNMHASEEGIHIMYSTDETIQFMTITHNGDEKWEPVRNNPKAVHDDAIYIAVDTVTCADGVEYLYGYAIKNDCSDDYGLFFLPLDAFSFAEEASNIEAPEVASATERGSISAVIDGVDADTVHLREGKSANSKSLGVYFTGTTVLCESDLHDEWVLVHVGTETGYIKSDYLRFADEISHVTPKQPTSVLDNGKRNSWVNLRSHPSQNAGVLAKVSNGLHVTLLGETKSKWCYVKFGDQYGYVVSEFLTIIDSSTSAGQQARQPSVQAGGTPAVATASSASEALHAYASVMKNSSTLFHTSHKQNVFLASFYDSIVLADMEYREFAVVDMDLDGMPEVVIAAYVQGGQYTYSYVVLDYQDGIVYGYEIPYRGLAPLKADGTISYNDGAAYNGFGRAKFQNGEYVPEWIAESTLITDSSGEAVPLFYIDHAEATEDMYMAAIKEQDNKPDAVWYQYTDANINAKIGAGL